MIPRADIIAWSGVAPWPTPAQVEQDLVLSRALCEIFARSSLSSALAFRGGTALHKLHFDPPARYSEDLDLVQLRPEPIGPVLDELRDVLDPWLGSPVRQVKGDSVRLRYSFETTALPSVTMRVKIEINTREHFALLGEEGVPFAVENPWFAGSVSLTTFRLEELLATKMRALYQRSKGRDLFDLQRALSLPVDQGVVVECFSEYVARQGLRISRAEFEQNLSAKLVTETFGADVWPLLREGEEYDMATAARTVREELIARLPGRPWQGAQP